jgi:hypothetical protein
MGTTTALVTLPAGSSLLASLGFYSSPFFDALLPLALVFCGLTIAGILVAAFLHWIPRAFHQIIHPKDRYEI